MDVLIFLSIHHAVAVVIIVVADSLTKNKNQMWKGVLTHIHLHPPTV